jgi:uncharacterized protein YhjY with autotransporter beta-barrel domain
MVVAAALAVIPALALASTGCDAVNAGAFNQTATYSNGAVTSTNAREVNGTSTLQGIYTSGLTGSTALSYPRWYPGSPYGFDAGEVITITVSPNATTGSLRGAFSRATQSTGAFQLQNSLTTAGSFSYTAVANEIGFQTQLAPMSSGSGTVSLSGSCTPVAVSAPTVTGISPTSGAAGGGTSVTITGANLSGASAVTFGATAATGFTVHSATQITATAPAGTGVVDVRVTTAGGTSATSAADQFTYTAAPAVTAMSPISGPTSGGTSVVLTGTGFSGATAVTFGATAATGFTVNSATQITATAPAGSLGAVDVRVTTAGGVSPATANGQFTYAAPPTPAPALTGIAPSNGPTAGGTSVVILGSNFTGATNVAFGISAATAFSVDSDGQITATSPAHVAGTVDIVVTTSGGTSPATASGQFTYAAPPTPAPALTGIAPSNGSTAGGTTVVILGSGFTGATNVAFGTSAATVFSVDSDSQITATSPAHAAGTVDIVVTTAGGTSPGAASGQFTYAAPSTPPTPAPALSSIAPSQGPSAGGTTVIILGSGFTGATNVAFGTSAATVFSVDSDNQITATSPAHAAGTVDIVVTTAGGASPTGAASQFAYNPPATVNVTLTPASLPSGTVSASYSQTLSAAGGVAPYAYAITAGVLPTGLTLSSTTGEISGAPTAAGTFNVTISATDSSGGAGPYTASQAYSLTIATPTLTVSPGALPAASVGAAYSQTLTASGGTAGYSYAISAGALPAGLTLTTSGVLSGAPTTGGTFNFTVTATDSSGGAGPYQASRALTLTVNPPTISLAPTTLPDATLNLAYSQTVSASGGVGGYAYAVTAGALPTGLSLSANGAMSGAPTVSGTFNFTISATDAATGAGPYTGARAFTLRVLGSTLSLSGGTLPQAQVGTPYSQTLTLSGGQAPYGYAVTGGVLPPGLTLSSSGGLTGAPTRDGRYVFTVTVTDAANATASQAHDLVVAPAPVVTTPPVTPPVTPPAVAPPVITPPAPTTVAPTTEGTPTGPSEVSLPTTTSGAVTRYEIETAPNLGRASLSQPAAGGSDWRLTYAPPAAFMGEATVQVVAIGPGGKSAPADFVFRVNGKAPDLSGTTMANQALVFEPTKALIGGPFQALRITRQPASGTAQVVGMTIVYTPGPALASSAASARKVAGGMASMVGESGSAAAAAPPSLDYVVVLPFGDSSPGRIDITAVAGPTLLPLTASTLAGRSVTVSLTDKAAGGPFTAARIVSVASGAGSATLVEGGIAGSRTYDLVFTPQGAFTGEAIVIYTLSNAAAATQGTLMVKVSPRPDPSLNPEVRGVISAELDSARRFARSQTDNFHRRLEQVRRGGGWSNGLRLNLAIDSPNQDPKAALRRQLGLPDIQDDHSLAAVPRALDSVSGLADAAPVVASGKPQGQGGVSPLGVWTAGAIDWGRRDARGQRDYRFSTSGVSGGVDWRLSDRLVLGVGGGYGLDRSKVGSEGSLSRGETYVGAVYGGWRGSDKLVIDGVLGYGALAYDSQRWSGDAGRMLVGDRSGAVLFGSASVALEQAHKALSWSPYARVQFNTVRLDGFTERGSDLYALRYSGLESRSLSSVVGASFDWAIQGHDGTLAANLRVEWRHEFAGTNNQTVAYADWAASPDYVVGLERWARDNASLTTGLEWRGVSGWSLGAQYNGEVGSDLISHGLRLKMLKGF